METKRELLLPQVEAARLQERISGNPKERGAIRTAAHQAWGRLSGLSRISHRRYGKGLFPGGAPHRAAASWIPICMLASLAAEAPVTVYRRSSRPERRCSE